MQANDELPSALATLGGVRRFHLMLGFLAGLLTPLAFAPFGVYPLAILSTAAIFGLWETVSPGQAAKTGFAYGAGTFLSGTYWLYISIHVFGQAPLALAVFLMLALVAIMGAYFALLGFLNNTFFLEPGGARWLLVLPATWLIIEWMRGWLFSGFPWLSLGYSQVDSPLGGWAPLGGVYAVSWATALSGGVIIALVKGTRRTRIGAVAIGAFLWLGGALLLRMDWTRPAGEPVRVALIQGSVSQDKKWLPEQFEPTKDLYEKLTMESLGSDLIVWPEAAIPALLREIQAYLQQIRAVGQQHGTDVLLGVLRYDDATGEYNNALLALGERAQIYTKRHLVPFGEYFPVPSFVREWMRLMSLPYADTAAGDARQPALEVAGQKIAASICYEDAFGSEQLVFFPEATLMVNVSNDAWFGDSIAPHQHLQIARMRAKEVSRYLLRATNTGISAILDEKGEVVARVPQFETRVLKSTVVPLTGSTPYTRTGNWTVLLAAAGSLLVGYLAGGRRKAGGRR